MLTRGQLSLVTPGKTRKTNVSAHLGEVLEKCSVDPEDFLWASGVALGMCTLASPFKPGCWEPRVVSDQQMEKLNRAQPTHLRLKTLLVPVNMHKFLLKSQFQTKYSSSYNAIVYTRISLVQHLAVS